MHQGIEYLLALIFGEMALHVNGPMAKVLLGGATTMAALAVLSKGPLGALRLLPPVLHRGADWALAAGLAVSPLVVRHHLDPFGLLAVELAAGAQAWLAVTTRYRTVRLHAVAGETRRRDVVHHPGARDNGRARGNGATAAAGARALGLVAGRARRHVVEQGPRADRVMSEGARRLGTTLGRRASRRQSS